MKPPIFEVEKLRVEREEVILHEVNWRVEQGQHWVILGSERLGQDITTQRVDRLPDAD